MITEEIEINNKLGLHARAAAKLVKLCSSFQSSIEMDKAGQKVNCKSIMGVMMLAASCGTVVTVTVEGEDEQDAMKAIKQLVLDKFDEDE